MVQNTCNMPNLGNLWIWPMPLKVILSKVVHGQYFEMPMKVLIKILIYSDTTIFQKLENKIIQAKNLSGLTLNFHHHGFQDLEIVSPNTEGGLLSQEFFNSFFHYRNRVVHWAESCSRLTFLINNKLSKIPFDCIEQSTSLFIFQVVPKRMSIFSIDINLAKEIKPLSKLNTFVFSKSFCFFISPWFLCTKLVTRKSKDP